MFFIPSNLLKNDWKHSDDKDINAIFICSFWNIDFLKLDTSQFQTFYAYQINPLGLTFFYSFDDVIKATNRYAVNTVNINRFRICFFYIFKEQSHDETSDKKIKFFFIQNTSFSLFYDRIFIGWTILWSTSLKHTSHTKSSYSIEYYFKMLTDSNIEEHK